MRVVVLVILFVFSLSPAMAASYCGTEQVIANANLKKLIDSSAKSYAKSSSKENALLQALIRDANYHDKIFPKSSRLVVGSYYFYVVCSSLVKEKDGRGKVDSMGQTKLAYVVRAFNNPSGLSKILESLTGDVIAEIEQKNELEAQEEITTDNSEAEGTENSVAAKDTNQFPKTQEKLEQVPSSAAVPADNVTLETENSSETPSFGEAIVKRETLDVSEKISTALKLAMKKKPEAVVAEKAVAKIENKKVVVVPFPRATPAVTAPKTPSVAEKISSPASAPLVRATEMIVKFPERILPSVKIISTPDATVTHVLKRQLRRQNVVSMAKEAEKKPFVRELSPREKCAALGIIGPDDCTDVDEILTKLKTVPLEYNHPRTMYLDKRTQISLVLKTTKSDSAKDFKGHVGSIKKGETKVSQIMQAELSGQDFDVEPKGPQERIISSHARVKWTWFVKPLEVGEGKSLSLNVSAILQRGNKKLPPVAIKTFRSDIVVDVKLWDLVVKKIAAFDPFYQLATATAIGGVITVILFGWRLMYRFLGRLARRAR